MEIKKLSLMFWAGVFGLLAAAQAQDFKTRVAEAVLVETLRSRCIHRLRVDPDLTGVLNSTCARYASVVVKALDHEKDSESGGVLFSKSDAELVLRLQGIVSFLESIRDSIRPPFTFQTRQPVDVYRLTRQWVQRTSIPGWRGSVDEKTARVIFVLFQDNEFKPERPKPPLHWIYLKEKYRSGVSEKTWTLLREILEAMRGNDPQYPVSWIQIYPPEIRHLTSNFNEKYYYYFLPYRLGLELKAERERMNQSDLKLNQRLKQQRFQDRSVDLSKRADVRLRVARLMPVLLSWVYKTAHGHNSYSKAILKKFKPTLGEPAWEYRYRDLYMAYLGSSRAQDQKRFWTFQEFRRLVASQPDQALEKISQTP